VITRASVRLWRDTWYGLQRRSAGERETACVWLGIRAGDAEDAREIVFLDDLPGTIGRRLQHRTSRVAVNMMLERARALGMEIVGDIHTHPSTWVDLSEVDRAHPIEYRVDLLALVLPSFAAGAPDVTVSGVHSYAGDGEWTSFEGDAIGDRFLIIGDDEGG
jgi:proteasome lid subunit RPN8/RPN11